jgi:hypothetical protein
VGLGGAAIGATGGAADVTQGSMAAVNAVENNRQLVETEKQALARLKQGKTKAEQDRLDAAACFLIKCSAEFPADSQEYAYYKALENKGAGLKTEQAALLAYKNESLEYKPVGYSNFSVEKVSVKDLFRYSQADANSDSQILAYSNNSNRIRNSLKDSLNLSDETIDRALNIGQGLLLIGSVIGGKGSGSGLKTPNSQIGSIGGRPTPKQSEFDYGTDLGDGNSPQVSILGREKVPYGTKGSVRPDFVSNDGSTSYEVKNYNIATNSNGLINNVANQAIKRAENLPVGMTQMVIIDTRGQTVTEAQRDKIRTGIVNKSNGIIKPNNIRFK